MERNRNIQVVAIVGAACAWFAGAPEVYAHSGGAISASRDSAAPLASDHATSGARGPLDADLDEPRPGQITGFMGWAFNIPLGSSRSFAKNASLVGFELQLNAWLSGELSFGVSGEWVTYMDNLPRTTFSVDDAHITATLYNRLQTTSIRLLAHYHLRSHAPFRPYVGPHIGASWSSFDMEAADLFFSDTQFSVNWGAEAGIIIPFDGGGPSALVNLRYSTSPAAEFRSIVSNVQSLSLMLGIGF
jgi:hypothetical protein